MAERSQIFVGRLHRDTRVRDLEDIFSVHGKINKCDIKYGPGNLVYGFVDFEDVRDAEDAIRTENGRELFGQGIVVEHAKGPRTSRRDSYGGRGGGPTSRPYFNGNSDRNGYRADRDECFRCHKPGHFARNCPEYDYYDKYRNKSRSPSYNRKRRSVSYSRKSRSYSSDRS